MKKGMVGNLLVGIAICFSLTSCSGLLEASEIAEILLEEETSAEEADTVEVMIGYADTILESIKNNDADSIAALYCQKVQEDYPQLTEDIQELIDRVDGEIVSDDGAGVSTSSAAGDESGYTYRLRDVSFRHITTSTGKDYRLYLEIYSVCRKHPEWIGVVNLELTDNDLYTYENNYPEEGYCQVCYEYYNPDSSNEFAAMQGNTAIDALKRRDTEAVTELFAPEIRKGVPNLKADVETWMESIEGKIVSSDSPSVEGTYSVDAELSPEYQELKKVVEYSHVKTDAGKDYKIRIEICVILEDYNVAPEIIGMKVTDNDDPEEGCYEVYYEEFEPDYATE